VLALDEKVGALQAEGHTGCRRPGRLMHQEMRSLNTVKRRTKTHKHFTDNFLSR
jgi:hypothetical protein